VAVVAEVAAVLPRRRCLPALCLQRRGRHPPWRALLLPPHLLLHPPLPPPQQQLLPPPRRHPRQRQLLLGLTAGRRLFESASRPLLFARTTPPYSFKYY